MALSEKLDFKTIRRKLITFDILHLKKNHSFLIKLIPGKKETMVLQKILESGVTGEETVAGPKISKLKEPVVGKFLTVMGKQKNSS